MKSSKSYIASQSQKTNLFLLLSLLLYGPLSFGQLVGVAVSPKADNTHSNARITALSLPFFDDFSLAKNNQPDPALWLKGGGTYINNTMTANHPTRNVITFDGTNAQGRPYVIANQVAAGATDTLTSQPIDLSRLTPADSLYLSFYWQARGGGELPDATDSIRVQLRDTKDNWVTVWKQTGGTATNDFAQKLLAIRDRSFFHANFQFRFQSFGRQSGAFDTWHVDYVYLNKSRRAKETLVDDTSCRTAFGSYLKRYSAMPLKQYIANTNETADTLSADMIFISNSLFNSINYNVSISNAQSGKVLQTFKTDKPVTIRPFVAQPIKIKPAAIAKNTLDTLKKITLITKLQLVTTDSNRITLTGVDLRRNDTISSQTVLDDYYAYDDGSAEFAAYMSRPLGRTVTRFVLNQPDFVNAVRMNFVPILNDNAGQAFTVLLYDNKQGKPGTLLYQKSFKLKYPDNRNDFIELPFDFYVAVKDTFYVGWQQISAEPLAVGLDRNNKREEHIFVNLGQEWAPYTSFKNDPNLAYFTGSLMLRPVMGAKGQKLVITALPKDEEEWVVFPNPTNGVIEWKPNKAKKIEIWNSNGILIQQRAVSDTENSTNLNAYPDGTYLIRLSNDQRSVIKKILLRK
jgi:Secretion system C-terminal sorting domain